MGILETNAYLDFEDLARETNADFTDQDVESLQTIGLDPSRAALGFLERDDLTGNFVLDVKRKAIDQGKSLTVKQVRAVLNIARDKLLGIKGARSTRDPFLDPTWNGKYKCLACGHFSDHAAEHIQHKMDEHGYELERGSVEQAIVAPESVLELSTESGFNFFDIPRGCYAVSVTPDDLNHPQSDARLRSKATSQGYILFYKVEHLKKPIHRNKRFVFGTRITGSQFLPIGTLEVREWESDRKELTGYQEPGLSYSGKYPFILERLRSNPEAWSFMFAALKGHCGICGKTLTTEISRALGVGPECEKNYGSLAEYYKARQLARLTGASV